MSAGNSSRSSGRHAPATRSLLRRGERRARQFWARSLSHLLIVAATLVTLGTAPASAATVYEITGAWEANTPTTVASGDVVTGVWRVNLNDDQPAPSNDPVDNVTFTVTLENGVFDSRPGDCLVNGVTPASSVSADGKTLVCNLGTHDQGTAVVLQAPVLVDGPTGSQVRASGSIAGQTADLDPIDIVNPFGMDIRWGTGTPNFTMGSGFWDLDMQWTLSKDRGSEPGPQTVTYDLTIASPQGGPVQVGPQGCAAFDSLAANGHPWSGGSHPANQTTSAVGSCNFIQTGPTTFQLILTGIDYNPASPPTLDSAGSRLPTDEVALASGSIWIRVMTDAAGSVNLTSSAPTYLSPTGATVEDDTVNNTESKAWTTPGTYSSGWGRGWTGSGGTTWDDTYRVSAGTEVAQYMHTLYQLRTARADNLPVGMCSALDTRHVTFNRFLLNVPQGGVPGSVVSYYTGNDPHLDPASAGYDPYNFDCAVAGGWSTTPPADPSQVKAVRYTMTQGQAEAIPEKNVVPLVVVDIKQGTPAGTDVWSFMTVQNDTTDWVPRNVCITPIPGGRYPCTTGYADVLRVVSATPAIRKSVDRSVVTPGAPATYTLTYSANGAGSIPPSVDGFEIVDTLPADMAFVPGSATPAPTVTTNGSGQQILTWTLDGVTTNADHPLTYQAVADSSATPGQTLTNSAVSSFGGLTTQPATAQVTVSTSGYTTIAKTADTPFISNLDGSGDGEGVWTVTLRSFDPLPQAFTDTIDILPWEGDQRGTEFEGSYDMAGVDAPGATVYYTTAPPASLSDDPDAPVNGAANAPSALWSTAFTPDATAVRVIGPELTPGAIQQFKVRIATDGAVGGDVYVNRAQARTEHTALKMRTSEPMTVANYYSASLKKFVQDRNGVWRDANDVADYPAFQYGDTVRYRIVVTNTGQGTLTNIDVTDDKQPALGNFQIASLAPGASESHEFSIVLDESTTSTVVNTASATADTPGDSNVPPTIPSDPAGFEVANYTIKKTSDPVSGSAVAPGDKVSYTVTVSQQGSAAAQATFSDALAGVLDNATYNSDVKASVGTVSDQGGNIAWNGTLPVGGVATITYSVTVKAKTGGDFDLLNVVTSPGCRVVAGLTPDCTTTHVAGEFTYSKASNPASTSTVQTGDTITYTVGVNQVGAGAVKGASITDDLSKVLDDATYNGDAVATAGTVSVTGDRLIWTGDLAVGAKVSITYSITVAGEGDDKLLNVVTGSKGGACVPGPDQNPYCTTTHTKDDSFDLVLAKRVVSGSQATAGDKVRYKLQVSNKGPDAAPAPIKLTDPLPQGLELVKASGKGWKCRVAKASDKVSCVHKQALGADRKASPVFVVAVASKTATGRVVNVAKVAVAGETARSNNRDNASITVVPAQLPSTGFRLMPPGA